MPVLLSPDEVAAIFDLDADGWVSSYDYRRELPAWVEARSTLLAGAPDGDRPPAAAVYLRGVDYVADDPDSEVRFEFCREPAALSYEWGVWLKGARLDDQGSLAVEQIASVRADRMITDTLIAAGSDVFSLFEPDAEVGIARSTGEGEDGLDDLLK